MMHQVPQPRLTLPAVAGGFNEGLGLNALGDGTAELSQMLRGT